MSEKDFCKFSPDRDRLDEGLVGYWLWRGFLHGVVGKFETAFYLLIYLVVFTTIFFLLPVWIVIIIVIHVIKMVKKNGDCMF